MTLESARQLRRQSTDAERLLWRRLRNRNLAGLKFRRQIHNDRYIVDFVCASHCLIVELDGGQHARRMTKDADRTHTLEARSYHVTRLWNNDVIDNSDCVVETVAAIVATEKFDVAP